MQHVIPLSSGRAVGRLLLFLSYVATTSAVFAQPGRISLVAGGVSLGEGRPATEAHFYFVGQIVPDNKDGVLIVDQSRIVRVDSDGILRTVAGSLRQGFSGDGGPASAATFRFDYYNRGGIALDDEGVIYVADTINHRIRKIDKEGIVRTIAGNGIPGAAGDGGPAALAQIEQPSGIVRAVDGTLYIAQPENHRIRKIDPNGTITTFAGDGVPPSKDGSGGELDKRRLNAPIFLALDGKNNLYVSDETADVVRIISPEGVVGVFAGLGKAGFSGDGGPATSAQLSGPGPLAVDMEGNIYIADRRNARIRMVTPDGVIETVAVKEGAPIPAGLRAIGPEIGYLSGLAVGADKKIYIAEGFVACRVRVIETSGQISLLAGASSYTGLDGPAAFARVDLEKGDVAGDKAGNLFINSGDIIRRIDASGRIGELAAFDRQPALGVTNRSIDADPDGGLVVLDVTGRVLRISRDGAVSEIAGARATNGFAGDGGPALQARFNLPRDIAVDAEGGIYVADQMNHRIRRIAPDGTISTIAGTGVGVSAGDNGPAILASLARPVGLAIERNGDLLIAEYEHRIRRISKADGRITKVIGDGTCTGNDLAQNRICNPEKMAVGIAGEIYVVHSGRIARLSVNGGKDILTPNGWRVTQANNAAQAFGETVNSVAVNSRGDLLFTTRNDNKVWKAQGTGPLNATPAGLIYAFALGAPSQRQSITLETGDGLEKPYEITSNAAWLTVNLPTGQLSPGAPVNLLVAADPRGLAKGSYTGKLTVRNPEDPAQQLAIAVSMTISGTPQQMRLSQTGFAFSAVQNGAVTSPRTLQVLNTGIGAMAWRATVQTLSGGNWLQVTPATGNSETGRAAPEIRIAANPAGLAPGVYFGLVSVAAAGVDNAPQSATIILSVTTQAQAPGPLIEPAGLLFTGSPQAPATAQEAQFANLTAGELTYSLSMAYPKDSPVWARITTANTGRVPAGGTTRFEVTPNTAGLKAGVYTADLLVTIGAEKTPRTVSLVLVFASSSVAPKSARAADGCVASRLIPVFVSPVPASQSPAGWPTSVSVRIADDCAQPLTDGRVAVSFSTGDPSISLVSEGGGRWSGTWAARTVNSNVTLTALARSTAPVVEGSGKLNLGVRADATRPLIEPGGVRSLASQLEGRPVPMAGPVLILGSQLVPEADKAVISPLPTELKGTSALIGGKLLRLNTVAATRLEGVLPSGIPDSTPLQMIVKRGNTYSVPEPVIVTLAEPAIFSKDGTGVGQGMVFAVEEDGRRVLADSERPLKPGDRMAILCTGIGPVDRPLADGLPAPEEAPPQAVNAIGVTIQNQEAEQVAAYLAPGLIGTYWVTAVVPSGVTADATADVIIRVGEQASPPVTAAILPPVVALVNP